MLCDIDVFFNHKPPMVSDPAISGEDKHLTQTREPHTLEADTGLRELSQNLDLTEQKGSEPRTLSEFH